MWIAAKLATIDLHQQITNQGQYVILTGPVDSKDGNLYEELLALVLCRYGLSHAEANVTDEIREGEMGREKVWKGLSSVGGTG